MTKDTNCSDYGAVYSIDLSNKEVTMMPTTYKLGRLDGLAGMDGGILVSHAMTGELFYITESERVKLATLGPSLADIGSDSKGTVNAPFLKGNKIISYKVITE